MWEGLRAGRKAAIAVWVLLAGAAAPTKRGDTLHAHPSLLGGETPEVPVRPVLVSQRQMLSIWFHEEATWVSCE